MKAVLQQQAPLQTRERRSERGKVLPNHDAFPPPPKVPTTWWQLTHHLLFFGLGLWTVLFEPSWVPDWKLTFFMYLYGDFMSALLHRTFDHEECLKVPALDFVAYGFQMHHAWPMESTRGVGLYRLFCDTVRIQWILLLCFAALSNHTLLAAQILYLKLLFGAYGSAVGHFYAHFPEGSRPFAVRILQRLHLLLPPQHHAVHHREPYNENLTSVSGLTDFIVNPLLKDCPFLPALLTLLGLSMFDIRLIEGLYTGLF